MFLFGIGNRHEKTTKKTETSFSLWFTGRQTLKKNFLYNRKPVKESS